jgi:hypothetical protein
MGNDLKLEECEIVRVMPDGALVVRVGGVERSVEIEGIEVPQPPPPIYFDILRTRLRKLQKPLRCAFHSTAVEGRVRARIEYLAWHDKSGEVWKDLGELLVEQGAARAASGRSDRA